MFEPVLWLVEPLMSSCSSKLNHFQQLLMTLMKLRLNLANQDLAYRFGVHASVVLRTLCNMIGLLYTVLVPLCIFWPDREQLRQTIPMCFSPYPWCAVIIDCFEIQLEKASDQTAISQTYSQYKFRNTEISYHFDQTHSHVMSFFLYSQNSRGTSSPLMLAIMIF